GLSGRLQLLLFSGATYPPLGRPAITVELGEHDFSDPELCVPFTVPGVAAGSYQAIALLDHDPAAYDLFGGGCLVDEADLYNFGGDAVTLDRDLDLELVLNYAFDPVGPP